MTKLTTHRFKIPVLIALAIAMVSSGAHAAKVDPAITGEAAQNANAAPIEEVGAVAFDFGNRMATGSIKLNNKNAKALGNVLANAITAKPSEILFGSLTNKADEIAEAAAILVARWATVTDVKKFSKGKAAAIVLNLMKGVFQNTKNVAGLAAAASPNFFQDVAGSVLLTAIQAPGTDSKTDDKIYKLLKKNGAKLAGKPNKDAIKLGLEEARLNDTIANTRYEDGNFGPIIDPETDTRNG